jgi:beta-phosphoglucomutase-like phosphatase (HAD superfamily)
MIDAILFDFVAAGMRVVAIPNDQSRQLDLSAADWQMPSLTAVAELLSSIP